LWVFKELLTKDIQLAWYALQKQPIKEVTCAKYLGLTIDKNLSWLEHVKQITKKANNFLQRNISKYPVQIKSSCYKALILEYASTVWSPHTKRDIENDIIRDITNNHSQYAKVCLRCYLIWTGLHFIEVEMNRKLLYYLRL